MGGSVVRSARKKNSDLYGIYRLDSNEKNMHGWLVHITRFGEHKRRYFSDLSRGGRHQSLADAKRFRDEIVSQSKLMTKLEYISILRRCNRSGFVGVCRVISATKSGKKVPYWVAFWPKDDGLRGTTKFSVAKHGEEKAFNLAVEARESALKSVVGPHINNRVHRVWLEEGRKIGK